MRKQKSETDALLENLAEAVAEHNKSPNISCEDPFDLYVERVQSAFFADENLFRSRFVKGYHILADMQHPQI